MTESALFLFSRTNVAAQPWLAAGYECICVDLQHPPGETREGNILFVGADLSRPYLPPLRRYVFGCAFVPCTHMAVSGARWFQDKGLDALHEALGLVIAARRILDWTEAPWFIENPVSTLSSYWRKPDYTFQPWQYGDLESKKTCLWTGGGFVMPQPFVAARPANVRESVWKMPPGADRGDKRSITPAGFARAVWAANDPRHVAESA